VHFVKRGLKMDDDIEQLRKQLVDAAFSASDSMFISIERSEVEKCDITATLGDLCSLLTRKNIRKFKHIDVYF